MVEEPKVIKEILADDEEVIGKWYLRGLLIRSYLFITNKRGFVYTKGIFFYERFIDFMWRNVSSIEGVRRRPLLPLIAFIFGLLSICFSSISSTFFSAIAVLLTIASIASYTYIRFGIGISVGCTLAATAPVLSALSFTFGPAEPLLPSEVETLGMVYGVVYGVISLILFIIGINIMSIYVVGGKPVVVPRLIADAIKTARTTKERFAGGDEP